MRPAGACGDDWGNESSLWGVRFIINRLVSVGLVKNLIEGRLFLEKSVKKPVRPSHDVRTGWSLRDYATRRCRAGALVGTSCFFGNAMVSTPRATDACKAS